MDLLTYAVQKWGLVQTISMVALVLTINVYQPSELVPLPLTGSQAFMSFLPLALGAATTIDPYLWDGQNIWDYLHKLLWFSPFVIVANFLNDLAYLFLFCVIRDLGSSRDRLLRTLRLSLFAMQQTGPKSLWKWKLWLPTHHILLLVCWRYCGSSRLFDPAMGWARRWALVYSASLMWQDAKFALYLLLEDGRSFQWPFSTQAKAKHHGLEDEDYVNVPFPGDDSENSPQGTEVKETARRQRDERQGTRLEENKMPARTEDETRNEEERDGAQNKIDAGREAEEDDKQRRIARGVDIVFRLRGADWEGGTAMIHAVSVYIVCQLASLRFLDYIHSRLSLWTASTIVFAICLLLRTGKTGTKFTFSWSQRLSGKEGRSILQALEEAPRTTQMYCPLLVSTLHLTPPLVLWINTRDFTTTAYHILLSMRDARDPSWLQHLRPRVVYFLLDGIWDTAMILLAMGNLVALVYIAFSLWDLTAKWDTSILPEWVKSATDLIHKIWNKVTGKTLYHCSCPALSNFISAGLCTAAYFLYFF